ncbi:MAG TPA: hypothetical protein VF756_26610 [Thermoanaerobaculia bacterium]
MRAWMTAFLCAPLLLSPALAQQEPPQEAFEDEITVALDTVVLRVVDSWGRPVLGLQPEDFRVRVGKREIPVLDVEWVSSGETESRPAPPEAEPQVMEEVVEEARPAGKLVVFFVQADLNSTRISGQMRLRPYTRDLLATLHPDDRVAVISYDSHLKLWQDFTQDRGATHEAIDRAMVFTREEDVPFGDPSLARHFDFAKAKKAASPERALQVMAEALKPLPGEKVVIFLGWGLGRFGSWGVSMTPDYAPAVRALAAARASVFVLDVTSADAHSLEVGLGAVAEATGGAYFRTFRLPGLATRTLARTILGHYVLLLDRDQLPAEGGKLKVELRDKKGSVLLRPTAVR